MAKIKIKMPKIYGEEDPQGKFSPQLRFLMLRREINDEWYMGFTGVDPYDDRCVQFLHMDGTVSTGVLKISVFNEKEAKKEWSRRKEEKIRKIKETITAINKEKWNPKHEGW